jgi:hypothetical protein
MKNGGNHSEETKKKISQTLKDKHARKNDRADPAKKKMKEMSDAFSRGNPKGKNPKVMNYGDFGPVIGVEPSQLPPDDKEQVREIARQKFEKHNNKTRSPAASMLKDSGNTETVNH